MKYVILLALFLISFKIDAQNKSDNTKQNQLPVEITSYIKTSFPNHKVLKHNLDSDGEFEVYLDKDVVLDFNKKNEIKSIDGKAKLPDTAIPAKILAYIKSSYAANSITDWEIDDKVQQVTLNNGVELEFNKAGEYIITDK